MRRALLVLAAASSLSTSVSTAAAPDPPSYVRPVDAVVIDEFRPPATRFGPGNRGLEYGTEAGTPVLASARGYVTFAGSVAGTLHVTVLHADGIRTTYSFLQRVDVVVGQRVEQGDRVGVTDGHLHLGARRGDDYFDPATLFVAGEPQVHLVRFDDPPGEGEKGERSAISQLIGGAGAIVGRFGGAAGSVGTWIRGGGTQLLRTLDQYAQRFTPPASFIDSWWTIYQGWQRARSAADRPCTQAGAPVHPPPDRRVAVLVAGLGSHSGSSTVDQVRTDALGYASSDVLRFSYAGGRVPDPTDRFQAIATTEYSARETQADLQVAGRRLADLLEEVARSAPGTAIDVIAHSQGGVVARLALIELERRHGVEWLEQVGMLATLGSPHGGADLATAVHAWTSTESGGEALDAFSAATDQELDDDATAIAQLAETSDLVGELGDHPVPESIHAVSIAARGDVVVPVPRSRAPGMEEVVIPLIGSGAHSDLPSSAEATRELVLARAGLPPGCQSFRAALLDQATGEGISLVEDLAGASGFLLAARADVRGP